MVISEKAKSFIGKYVLSKMGATEINDDNLGDIVQFIVSNYEVPLAQTKEARDNYDVELLELSTNIVTEITTNPDW